MYMEYSLLAERLYLVDTADQYFRAYRHMIEVETEVAYEISALRRILAYYDTGVVQAYDFRDGELSRANTKYDFTMPLAQQAYSVWEGKHWMGGSGSVILELDREGNQLGSHTLPSDIGTIFGLDHHEDELIVFGGDKVYRFDDDFNEIANYDYDSDTPIVRSGCVVRWTYFYVPYHPDRTLYAYDTDMNRVSGRDWVYTTFGNVRGSEYVDGYIILLHRRRSGGQNLSTLAVYRYDDLNFDGSTVNVPLQTIEIAGEYGHAMAAEKHFSLFEYGMAYGVRKLVQSEVEMAYAIQQFMAMVSTEFEVESAFGVRKLVASESEMAYGIRKGLDIENEVAYTIRKFIENESRIEYAIRKIVQPISTLEYSIRKLVESEIGIEYSIEMVEGTTISTYEYGTAYAIRKQIANESGIAYDIRKVVSSEAVVVYAIRRMLDITNTVAYGIRKLVPHTRVVLGYSIRKLIENESSVAYGIRKLVEGIENVIAYVIESTETIVHGTASEKFMNDLVTVIGEDERWNTNAFGKKPSVNKKYDRKVLGYGRGSEDAVLVHSDSDRVTPFGLGTATNYGAWRHDVSASIEVTTSLGDKRFKDLLSQIVDILKQNVTLEGYVKLEVVNVHNESDELRNAWRGIIDVEAMVIDP